MSQFCGHTFLNAVAAELCSWPDILANTMINLMNLQFPVQGGMPLAQGSPHGH